MQKNNLKSKIFLFHFSLFLFTLSVSHAADLSSLRPLIQKYELGGMQIGVHILSLTDGRELFAYKADRLLNPASNTKIITAAAALQKLGVNFTYQTPFTTDSPPQDGAIQNLYVKGMGDPSIVEEVLWRMAKDLALRGITTVTGDIIIDQSYFDDEPYQGPLFSAARVYSAPVSPFALNFNTFAVLLKPTTINQPAVANIDPPATYFDLKNNLTTGTANSISITRRLKDQREEVRIGGTIRHHADEMVKYYSISNPTRYAGSTLKKMLEQNGIQVLGRVREGKVAGHTLLFTNQSKPLSLIIQDLNKYSSNFTAEMLVKTLGAQFLQEPGTTPKGMQIIKDYLTGLGIPATSYILENGSGLTRKNRISASLLTNVLREVYRQFDYQPEMIASLAIGGVDGTARDRLKKDGVYGKTRVKTGTLNDVSALSGYMPTKEGDLIAFAILAEGPGAGGAGLHELHENITWQLSEESLK